MWVFSNIDIYGINFEAKEARFKQLKRVLVPTHRNNVGRKNDGTDVQC